MSIADILIAVRVIQTNRMPDRSGFAMRSMRRLNPLNPLSYATVIAAMLIGFICFGVVGFWREVDMKNPFVWQ